MKNAAPKIPKDSLKSLMDFQGATITRKEATVENLKGDIYRLREDARRYRAEAHSMSVTLKDIIAKLKSLKADRDPEKEKEKSLDIWSSLWRHSMVEKVNLRGAAVDITTKLLFQDIRKEAGSELKRRVCLGSFLITFSLDITRVYIRNLTFPSARDTWAISGYVPCMGEWQDDFMRAFREKDYMAVIDLCFHFIRAADTDGGAYMRSHEWAKENRTLVKKDDEYDVGEYIVCTGKVDREYDTLMCVGKVSSPGNALVRPRVDFKALSTGVVNRYSLVVEPELCMKITKEQYDSCNVMEKLPERKKATVTNETLLKKVDKLENGSTHADVMALVEKLTGQHKV